MLTAAQLLAMSSDMPEPTSTTPDAPADVPEDQPVADVEPSEASPEPAESVETAPAKEPINSAKIGWGQALKELEARGEVHLAEHARRIQADATRKSQEAANTLRAAEAMMAEAKKLIAQASAKPVAEPIAQQVDEVDPWNPESLRKLAQAEARRLLEEELAPIRAEREAQLRAAEAAQREAQLDAFLSSHPDFDDAMQDEAASLILKAQEAGRFVSLEDAYTIAKARRTTAEAARLVAEAEAAKAKAAAAARAKQAAVSKVPPSAPTGSTGAASRKPPVTAADYLRLAKN